MQKTIRTKRKQVFKKSIQRKLIREYRTYGTRTMFFATIAAESTVLDKNPELFDDAIDFLEIAYKTFHFDLIDSNDDKRILYVGKELYDALRAVFLFNITW